MFSSASHEIDVMPWVFGRDVIRVNWFSPAPLTTGSLCDPEVVILELEGGALIFDELFVKSGYGYEIRCEIAICLVFISGEEGGRIALAVKDKGESAAKWISFQAARVGLAGRVALRSEHDLFAQHGQDARIDRACDQEKGCPSMAFTQ